MPIYSYECSNAKCPHPSQEHVVPYVSRDLQTCEESGCGSPLKRAPVEAFAAGKPGYQMQAVLSNGQHVKGHFGKFAKNKSRKG